jgi:hypothetical protein
MLVTVMGKYKRPYEYQGKSGTSYRLSVFCGAYASDDYSGAVGEGDKFLELRCSEAIYDGVSISDDLSVEVDLKYNSIKSAMISIVDSDGRKAFIPLGA